MSTPDLKELAAKPAGIEQINRAREICGKSVSLNAKLDAFLNERPSRGQMVEFMNELKETGFKEVMKANILRICKSVGIEEPTGTDKLLRCKSAFSKSRTTHWQVLLSAPGKL